MLQGLAGETVITTEGRGRVLWFRPILMAHCLVSLWDVIEVSEDVRTGIQQQCEHQCYC